MSRRVIGYGLLLAYPAAVVGGELADAAAVGSAIALAAVVVGIFAVPRFFRTLVRGALAGAVAGVLVLGTGMRLAMRVVAIMDPDRTPEFTAGGTLFLLIGIGAMFGGLTFAHARVTADTLGWRFGAPVLASIMTAILLFGPPDIRAELTDLGAGAWVNVPLFGAVVVAYAVAANRLSRWRMPVEAVREDASEEAPGVAQTIE